MPDILLAMRALALRDEPFRLALLGTQHADEPLLALCDVAATRGFALTPEDVLGEGEAFSCQQAKSTNGGNPIPAACFDDALDMFMISIAR